ncbi:MAG: cytochrome c oxidase assembly protein [Gammaproteobacteria bacterium]|nr:cytochrome c oxidase assembly protein [Gammaproteobacteria bacterium]
MPEQSVKRTTGKLVLMAVAMFGFGYLLVPIYNVFCEITGLNGKTGQISVSEVNSSAVDVSRLVTVEFDTNVRELPWDFEVVERKVRVHPGEIGEAVFRVRNNSGREVVGRAIPSVAPTQAAVYFDKTECFCFQEQPVRAGEEVEMVVRFVVNTKLPSRFESLVLSYTFFEVPNGKTANVRDADHKIKS